MRRAGDYRLAHDRQRHVVGAARSQWSRGRPLQADPLVHGWESRLCRLVRPATRGGYLPHHRRRQDLERTVGAAGPTQFRDATRRRGASAREGPRLWCHLAGDRARHRPRANVRIPLGRRRRDVAVRRGRANHGERCRARHRDPLGPDRSRRLVAGNDRRRRDLARVHERLHPSRADRARDRVRRRECRLRHGPWRGAAHDRRRRPLDHDQDAGDVASLAILLRNMPRNRTMKTPRSTAAKAKRRALAATLEIRSDAAFYAEVLRGKRLLESGRARLYDDARYAGAAFGSRRVAASSATWLEMPTALTSAPAARRPAPTSEARWNASVDCSRSATAFGSWVRGTFSGA